jgi:hypothetical protein
MLIVALVGCLYLSLLVNAHNHEFLSASNFRSANAAPVRTAPVFSSSNQFNPLMGLAQPQQSFAPPQFRNILTF